MTGFASMLVVLGLLGAVPAPVPVIDLAQIGHISSKGRVQDRAYNPALPVVDALIDTGPAAIPYLVAKLEDETEIDGAVMDFWPRVRVGDVALVILCDLFTKADWKTATIPALGWDAVLERRSRDKPARELLEDFLAIHGRSGLRRKVETLLKPYDGLLTWDSSERCFKPTRTR